jgi:flagellar biosynthesis/type III secretory pathway M-ring protein FliF/YscJ
LNKYRDLIAPISAAVIVLVFLLFVVLRFLGRKRKAEASAAQELEAGPRPAEIENTPAAGQISTSGKVDFGDDQHEVTERVRQMAKRDVGTAANIVRLWLQDNKS